ncbi:hypothetical protein [uncultured Methanobrevibacter sp.]|uniref:hypothetical protein n=1 Tax=uncultured Methanobrevibacter sp. TaxID=253161 RepID=UPI0025CF9C94|nr:hypothetical protein [uncultured Methanobrevibacter sp.]
MDKSRLFIILTSLIIILVAIGSAYADSNDGVVSDGDLSDDEGDSIPDDDFDDDFDDDSDYSDDEDFDDEDLDDDSDDDESEEEDGSDEEYESDEDIGDDLWELGSGFRATSKFLDAAASKDMLGSGSQNMSNSQNSNNDGGVDLGITAGNPALLLLLCLLSLILIPFKNK